MHRRKDIYGADAEEFNPERWETVRPGWSFLPFSGGPRMCLGRKSNITDTNQALRIYCKYANLEIFFGEQSS